MANYAFAVGLFLIFAAGVWLSWLKYSKKKYALSPKELYVGGGILGLRHSLIPLYKVQNVQLTENPYQWRRGLASVLVHSAAGTITIPYIPKETAIELLDLLTYRVEVSRLSWM